MPAARIVPGVIAIILLLITFNAFFLDLWEAPLEYEGLPWFYKDAESRTPVQTKGDEYLIGVGKADITGYAANMNTIDARSNEISAQ